MADEPLFVLIERMRRALQDAARVRAKVEDRLRELDVTAPPAVEPPSVAPAVPGAPDTAAPLSATIEEPTTTTGTGIAGKGEPEEPETGGAA